TSLAHVNPIFVFDELVVTHYCGSMEGFCRMVVSALAQQAVAQGYKVLGSMELLGDPLSLVNKLGDSVVQFFQTTKAEITGGAGTRGEGARVLVKGVVGGTFSSAAKITGSLEDFLRGLSGTPMGEDYGEDDDPYGDEDRGEGEVVGGEVKSLEHGMKQGGRVFMRTMKAGISGLVDRPMEGAKEEGVPGFIAGVAKGLVGAVAAPVVGALGAVSRVTEGVDVFTRLADEKSMGRRRAPRTSASSPVLTVITDTDMKARIPRKFVLLFSNNARQAAAAAAIAASQKARDAEQLPLSKPGAASSG
ncbi:unnamed protein product, partial [Discosporangium mesarthrocarpum]